MQGNQLCFELEPENYIDNVTRKKKRLVNSERNLAAMTSDGKYYF